MKAFDAHLDKSARDSGFDLLASRALSREMELSLRSRFAERQKLNVACNYFALACPIMPVGLLGAFLMLEKLSTMEDKAELDKITLADLAKQRTDAAQEMYAIAMREKQELEKRKTALSCSRPVETVAKVSEKPKKRKDVAVDTQGKRSERMGGPNLLSKAHNDVSKIVKEKSALESHLDKLSRDNDYALVARVSSQIELLEKALKKVGS